MSSHLEGKDGTEGSRAIEERRTALCVPGGTTEEGDVVLPASLGSLNDASSCEGIASNK